MKVAEKVFDITDGRNHYEPCPKCGIDFLMGISSDGQSQYVVCAKCGHKGPGIELPPPEQYDSWPVKGHERDRIVFEAWNEESRRARGDSGKGST